MLLPEMSYFTNSVKGINNYIKVPSGTVAVTLQFITKQNLFIYFFNLRIGKKMQKISNNFILKRGSTPISTNLVVVHPRNIYTIFKANPCIGLREVNNGIYYSDHVTTQKLISIIRWN